MKKELLLACAAVAAVVLTGCTSIVTSDGANVVPQPSSKHPGYDAKFVHKDVRVEGNAQINVLFGIFSWGVDGLADNSKLSSFAVFTPSENAKSSAVYNACRKNKADLLIGTRYTLTITNYGLFKTIHCKVAGFPATMAGIKERKAYLLPNGKLTWLSDAPIVVK